MLGLNPKLVTETAALLMVGVSLVIFTAWLFHTVDAQELLNHGVTLVPEQLSP